jgi:nucleotide-binding universal stress UspA family protein
MSTNYRIVVGVDGSEGGRRALRWSVHEAATRGGTVQAVSAWRWDAEPSQAEAERLLAGELEALRAVVNHSAVIIASEVVEGRAADVLTAAARDADLLVLGSHGHSEVHHTVLGSVSEECVRKASCPVVVLPVPQPSPVPSAEPAVRA